MTGQGASLALASGRMDAAGAFRAAFAGLRPIRPTGEDASLPVNGRMMSPTHTARPDPSRGISLGKLLNDHPRQSPPERNAPVGTKETPLQRGRRRGSEITRATICRLRDARIAEGVSQAALARQVELTQAYMSLFERNELSDLGLIRLAEVASILGLEPALSLHPIGPPLRDKGHEALIKRFLNILSSAWKVTREVPFPNEGDPRWWDALLKLETDPTLVGLEAETRIRDLQALTRRMRGRAKDGGADAIVIALSDTRTNREIVSDFRAALGPEFAGSPAAIVRALQEGVRPPGSGVLLL